MECIAKNAKVIYIFVVLLMLIKTFMPIEQQYNIIFSILFVLIVLPVIIIEFYVKKRRKGMSKRFYLERYKERVIV